MSFVYIIQKEKREWDKGQVTLRHIGHIKEFRNRSARPGKPEKDSRCGITQFV